MTRRGPKPNAARNAQILALRGKLTYQLIADRLDISVGAVSGVCFRADYPLLVRRRRTGTGFPTRRPRPRVVPRSVS